MRNCPICKGMLIVQTEREGDLPNHWWYYCPNCQISFGFPKGEDHEDS